MTNSDKAASDLAETPPRPTHTDRTLICFEPEVPLARLIGVREALPRLLEIERTTDFDERTVILPEWKILIAPVPLERLRAVRDLPLLEGIRSADWESITYIPPGPPIPPEGPITEHPLLDLGVLNSSATGKGVTLAILDTGLDFMHPDFVRDPRFKSPPTWPLSPQDQNGHGTQVTGLACGPKYPADGSERYGVACEANALIIRVTQIGGVDDEILVKALTCARDAGADIIVMSMGAGQGRCPECLHSVAAHLLEVDNILLIAAAGNAQSGVPTPVGYPASCVPIMAVAGLDANLGAWDRSCVSIGVSGDEIDVSAPGQGLLTANLGSGTVHQSGTSMANGIAAGVAALWAQYARVRGKDLKDALTRHVKTVSGRPDQVGPGMALAPP